MVDAVGKQFRCRERRNIRRIGEMLRFQADSGSVTVNNTFLACMRTV